MPCRSRARPRPELPSERRVEALSPRIRREQHRHQSDEAADDRYEAEQDEEPAEIGIVQATDADREVRDDRRDQRPPPVFAAAAWSPSRTSTEVSCRLSGSLAFATNSSSPVTVVPIPTPQTKNDINDTRIDSVLRPGSAATGSHAARTCNTPGSAPSAPNTIRRFATFSLKNRS